MAKREIKAKVKLQCPAGGANPAPPVGPALSQHQVNIGEFVKRFTQGPPLNQPWGLALAPEHFGPFSKALLVGNNLPGGKINAFNAATGKFLGALKEPSGRNIEIDQLWGLEFGGGTSANGAANQLFYTAGPSNYGNGAFGVINFVGK